MSGHTSWEKAKKRYRIEHPEWDRIDLVDRGANQYAEIVIAKAFKEEDERDEDEKEEVAAERPKTKQRMKNELKNGPDPFIPPPRKKRKKDKKGGKAKPVLEAEGLLMKHKSHNQQDHDPTKGKGGKQVQGQRSFDESGATISDSQSDASRRRMKDKAKRTAKPKPKSRDQRDQAAIDRWMRIVDEDNKAAAATKKKGR